MSDLIVGLFLLLYRIISSMLLLSVGVGVEELAVPIMIIKAVEVGAELAE
jgi:hypothetical protein